MVLIMACTKEISKSGVNFLNVLNALQSIKMLILQTKRCFPDVLWVFCKCYMFYRCFMVTIEDRKQEIKYCQLITSFVTSIFLSSVSSESTCLPCLKSNCLTHMVTLCTKKDNLYNNECEY